MPRGPTQQECLHHQSVSLLPLQSVCCCFRSLDFSLVALSNPWTQLTILGLFRRDPMFQKLLPGSVTLLSLHFSSEDPLLVEWHHYLVVRLLSLLLNETHRWSMCYPFSCPLSHSVFHLLKMLFLVVLFFFSPIQLLVTFQHLVHTTPSEPSCIFLKLKENLLEIGRKTTSHVSWQSWKLPEGGRGEHRETWRLVGK